LEHFTRHLGEAELAALKMSPEEILAREPDPAMLAQFPERTPLNALAIPVEYRFAPGEADDGAALKVPLLALPQLTRVEVRAAVPGLAVPRVEALLRSLPKDARRSLIPIGETVREFLRRHSGAADLGELSRWLHETRGIPEPALKFDVSALPKHLDPQIAVMQQGRELGRGSRLPELRRQFALDAQSELLRLTQQRFGSSGWRRFEWEELPESATIELEQGNITLYPALIAQGRSLKPGFAWSSAEAARRWEQASVLLARQQLSSQARDMERRVLSMTPLILSASAYFSGQELAETLLHLSFKAACFGEVAAPRTRTAFEAAVEQGRAQLHEALDAAVAQLSNWLSEATSVRREIEADTGHADQAAALEAREHLRRLFAADTLQGAGHQRLRQWPRYLKAEQRRWQRNRARGAEPSAVLQELQHWSRRLESLQQPLAAELRWHPKYEELKFWVEEYRVSLYAQELKTVVPVSAARLEELAAEVEAWLKR
jgi:ATP-dependent helicase HrpA